MDQFIDVTAGSRRVSPQDFQRALDQMLTWAEPRGGTSLRHDGRSLVDPRVADAYHRYVDAQCLAQIRRDGRTIPSCWTQKWQEWAARQPPEIAERLRRDAAGFSGGTGAFLRELEFVRTELLKEVRQPLNSDMLPKDTSVPLGAKTFTQRRVVGSGEAAFYRDGDKLRSVRSTRRESTFNTAYIYATVETSFFETLSTDWIGYRKYQQDLEVAMRAVLEKDNDTAWFGSEEMSLFGVLNYPFLATSLFPFTVSSSSDARQVVRNLNNFVYTPVIGSGAAFEPNIAITSPRMSAYLWTEQHSPNATDSSAAKWWLENQDPEGGIKEIKRARELEGIGPNGEDGMLLTRLEKNSIAKVDVQPPTVLPVFQSSVVDQITMVYLATGGVTMYDVGNSILVLIPIEGLGVS